LEYNQSSHFQTPQLRAHLLSGPVKKNKNNNNKNNNNKKQNKKNNPALIIFTA